jgi:hypothetical protein
VADAERQVDRVDDSAQCREASRDLDTRLAEVDRLLADTLIDLSGDGGGEGRERGSEGARGRGGREASS